MLGFNAFERYFGDDQAAFKKALADRGFQINPTAHAGSAARPNTRCLRSCARISMTACCVVLKDHITAMAEAPKLSVRRWACVREQ
jgi:hypothetical protein